MERLKTFPVLLDSRLTALKKSQPWIVNDSQPVRRGDASAFGFGGTNFHVVMEEYKSEHSGVYRVGAAPISEIFYPKALTPEEFAQAEAPKAAPVPAAPSGKAAVDMCAVIAEAIADKTGYPADMIDEDMELEADLGIDSIKRVEIFADALKKLSLPRKSPWPMTSPPKPTPAATPTGGPWCPCSPPSSPWPTGNRWSSAPFPSG